MKRFTPPVLSAPSPLSTTSRSLSLAPGLEATVDCNSSRRDTQFSTANITCVCVRERARRENEREFVFCVYHTRARTHTHTHTHTHNMQHHLDIIAIQMQSPDRGPCLRPPRKVAGGTLAQQRAMPEYRKRLLIQG